jgi:prepilin-type N-terminal cleavage/methylation domain-containing protein/prepilin-type processing-associated H-X9-DG protein
MYWRRKAFTLIELLVVIAVIAVLMAILMPALNRAREQGKRAMCQGNLKSLQLAWTMYADENNDNIVSGAAGIDRSKEWWWVGKCWTSGWQDGVKMPERDQLLQIKAGALYSFMGENHKAYRCPTGERGDIISFAITDAMNGLREDQLKSKRPNGIQVYIKKTAQIQNPGKRMVFLDEGRVPWDSFALHYGPPPTWWDAPQARHGFGTNLSFADGHVEYWKWSDPRTVQAGREALEYTWPVGGNKYSDDNEDLVRVAKALFGTMPR